MSIEIVINGDARSFDAALTVTELVGRLGVRAEGVAVEVNREIVPKSRWAEQSVGQGDTVEIVTFVGGG
jgi:thiamine biosynthesis protein ThiS